MDAKKTLMKAAGFLKTAGITTAAGLGVIWGAKKVAERTPIDVDEDVLNELTGD